MAYDFERMYNLNPKKENNISNKYFKREYEVNTHKEFWVAFEAIIITFIILFCLYYIYKYIRERKLRRNTQRTTTAVHYNSHLTDQNINSLQSAVINPPTYNEAIVNINPPNEQPPPYSL